MSVIDFSKPQDCAAFKFLTDPVTMLECFWAFYDEQLTAKGFTEDSFDEAVDETVMDELRDKFIPACAAFFPFIKTLRTQLPENQLGRPTSPAAENLKNLAASTQ